jgi:RimJ/RimL family protein N-acetyltransferase
MTFRAFFQMGRPLGKRKSGLTGEAIGGIGFEVFSYVHQLTAEIGYWLGEAFWEKGIATAAGRPAK